MSATIAIEAGARPVRPAGAAPASARDIVLLVEDDEGIARLLACIIERLHWRVRWSPDGADCRRQLAAHRAEIALAFVDCTLPDVHGGSLCQELRAALPALPILLTSGRAQSGLLELVAADGPAGFLPKPFLPGDVARHLAELLPARAA